MDLLENLYTESFIDYQQGIPVDIQPRMLPMPIDPNNPDFGPDFSLIPPSLEGNGPFGKQFMVGLIIRTYSSNCSFQLL